MKAGFVIPKADARQTMELARLAEQSGWDGIFVWEPVWGVDAWVSLAAAAVVTAKIHLGTLLSPASRMRPWKLASESATLDNLSGGRVILSVGLGAADTGFHAFGEETDMRVRAELMDECLAIVRGLWQGQPFHFEGKHYQVKPTEFHLPASPVNGIVPVWVVGLWPNNKSMSRTQSCQGVLPSVRNPDGSWRKLELADVQAIREYAGEHGNPEQDIIVEAGYGDDSAPDKDAWRAAGATWYIDSMWEAQDEPDVYDRVVERLSRGP